MHYYVSDYGRRSRVFASFKNVLTVMTDMELRNELANEQIAYLNQRIEQLQQERPCINGNPSSAYGMTFSTFRVDTAIRTEYIMYIQKYGVPEDGIFIPSLLAEFTA